MLESALAVIIFLFSLSGLLGLSERGYLLTGVNSHVRTIRSTHLSSAMAEGGNETLLVSCEWLQDKITTGDTGNIVVLDVTCSSDKDFYEDYKQRHIPGAAYINVLLGPHSESLPRNIPQQEVFQKLVRAVGVNDDSHVILYSDSEKYGFFVSGRAWWTFKIFGANTVSILDGGLQKWLSLGYPTVSGVTDVQPGNFTARFQKDYYCTFDQASSVVGADAMILDSRPVEIYKQGHVPGARNLPYSELIDEETKTMKSISEIRAVLQGAGVDLDKPVVCYCNSGMSSCTLFFASKLCGAKDVSLYHGGFTLWKKNAPENIEKCCQTSWPCVSYDAIFSPPPR